MSMINPFGHGRPSKAEQANIDKAWASCGTILLAAFGILVSIVLFGS